MVTHCVNCGAPINPHVEKCEYCDSYYSTMGVKNTKIERDNESFTVNIDSVGFGVLSVNEIRGMFGLKPLRHI